MKTVYFYTPTLLSYLDLMSMGGSEKAEDDSKIGRYCSGLKHSMALFHRHNVGMVVRVWDTEFSDNYERKRETAYHTATYTEFCEQTGKEKELFQIHKNVTSENFHSATCNDYGGGEYPEEIIKTSFSVKLGIDWSLFMGLREVFSNMIDENGWYSEIQSPPLSWGTVFEISFEEGSEFDEIWLNRHLYINEKEPLYDIGYNVQALENPEGYLRIYKQNILVHSDEKTPSKFAYNCKFGDIDERRVLSNVYSVGSEIAYAIKVTNNAAFLREIITGTKQLPEKDFLCRYTPYGTASDLVHDIAYEVWSEHGDVKSYDWLIDSVKKRKDCKIGGKIIQSIGDSVYSYSTNVRIETQPETISEPDMEVDEVTYSSVFSSEIKKYYNFNLDVEVKQAKLKGSRCIADKHCKCIIIDENFSIEDDFPAFIIEYVDLTMEGNAVKNLGEYICKLLRK